MRVFVLSTGRCGSTTFAHACSHISNYTAAHESRIGCYGEDRFKYADNHIEADNRLSWMLGALDRRFGADAFYVHLWRDPEAVAHSFASRWPTVGARRLYRLARKSVVDPYGLRMNIIGAFANSVVMRGVPWQSPEERLDVCRFYVQTVTENINAFLKDKGNRYMSIQIEDVMSQFPNFWDNIGAKGDFDGAVSELKHHHNAGRHQSA